MAVDSGTAVTIAFATSGFTAQLTSLSLSMERGSLDTTTTTTTVARTFIPTDLIDPGEITLDLYFDTDIEPPIKAAAETVTITWPDPVSGGAAGTFACSGFMTAFEATAPEGELMTGSATVKLTGDYTWTDST